MNKSIIVFCASVYVFTSPGLNAQTFGFGCLGFVGGYGGFTYQQYNPEGFNDYIEQFNLAEFVNSPIEEFSFATGYRVGLNFFRATFPNGIIVTAKGFYQSLDKTNKGGVGITGATDNYALDMDLRSFSFGFDVGWQFTNIVGLKILDGSLNFNNITLTQTTDLPGSTTVNKYESDTGIIGYSIGAGIIFSIIKDYVSIEGLAAYTHLSVDNLYDDTGTPFLNPPAEINSSITADEAMFIETGGFTAVLQLNFGFPLL